MREEQKPPADRFCDLVMKGGITSGVVYPEAIAYLARHYRFKNIGGTSAGAIAAALTAAAEFQRRQTGSHQGFDRLQALPAALQQEVAPGERRLLSLFQPQPGTRRLFAVLAAALNSRSAGQRILRVVLGAVRTYWGATLVAVLLALAVALLGAGLYAALLTAGVALVAGLAAGVYRDATGQLVENGFGLCSGMGADASRPALTPWLHAQIQQAAGRDPADARQAPLTFGDLWDAPGFPVPPFTAPPGAENRSINLQIFSTNLSHGRPYIFPLAPSGTGASRFRAQERLYFRREELAAYLPAEVLEHLCSKARPYVCEADRAGRDPSDEQGQELGMLRLPEPRDLPVLLAARLSLSFPLLISAVPLWSINHDPAGQARFRRCWFSDGGISSNFPMHLFDSLLPAWPTFGINLEDVIAGRDRVFLPPVYTSGYGERWYAFGRKGQQADADDPHPEPTPGAARLGGFVLALVNTMQNWNDNALSRMPGVRDRIARVRLAPDEGGLNLNMEAETIRAISGHGLAAAHRIVERFATKAPGSTAAPGWDEQRWVRLGVLLKLLQERGPGVRQALQAGLPHTTDFAALADAAAIRDTPPPAGYEERLAPEQHRALLAAIAALEQFMDVCTRPGNATDFQPIPKPELRLRPPL